jgi:hypothetical protein
MRTGLFLLWMIALLVVAPVTLAQDDAGDTAEDIISLTEDTAEGTLATVEDFLNRLVTPPEGEVTRLLMLFGGVILLVLGWRIYEYIILISGVLIGAAVGANLVADSAAIVQIVALVIGGLLGGILSILLYYVAVFIIGAYTGMVLTAAIAGALNLTPISALALLIAAIVGGLILLGLSMELLAFVSAVVGAQMIALALDLTDEWIIILAFVGIVLQLGIARLSGTSIRRRPRRVRLFRRG